MCSLIELDIRVHVEFAMNQARRLGGGIHVKNADRLTLSCLQCNKNVAPGGGALSIVNSKFIRIEGSSACVSSFTGNVAVNGGALLVCHTTSQNGTYEVDVWLADVPFDVFLRTGR